ncbi:MAG: hypothetical protein J5552_13065 [Prevotella sp.]|nr:hypothetical protein [Prevotella sp.]
MKMKKKYIILCVAALLSMARGYCGVTLTVPEVSIAPGGTSFVTINFDLGAEAYTAYQLDIAYPEGISSITDTNGEPVFIKGDVYTTDHNVSSVFTSAGLSRFQCFSINSLPFTEQSGTLLILSIKAQNSMAEGTYQATIAPIEFVQTNATPDRPDAVTFNIKVTKQFVLDEESTLPPGAANGVQVQVKRTINANVWSTICLPFAMSQQQVATAFGTDVQLGDFNDYDFNEEAETINVKFKTATSIEANHPYIIKVSTPVTSFTAEGVDIDPEDEPMINLGTKRKPHAMVGTYKANTTVPDGCLFLSGGKFWYSTGMNKMKGYRAWFNFDDLLPDYENMSDGTRISITYDGSTVIDDVQRSTSNVKRYYDLQGRQRPNSEGRGMFISNGKKIVK